MEKIAKNVKKYLFLSFFTLGGMLIYRRGKIYDFIDGINLKKNIILVFLFVQILYGNLFSMDLSMALGKDKKSNREIFVEKAKECEGAPYAYGGIGPHSFDCSGFVYYLSSKFLKIQLPRTSKAICDFCKRIPFDKKEIGDLLFFKTTGSKSVSHVGIYIGNNKFIHAASNGPKTGVIISSLDEKYWKSHFFCVGKFLP